MVNPDSKSLRERLVAAKLAGTKNDGGYLFRSNEAAADVAAKVFAEWMRDLGHHVITIASEIDPEEDSEDEEDPVLRTLDGRDRDCVDRWPECFSGGYDPRCCRFPKSCSC